MVRISLELLENSTNSLSNNPLKMLSVTTSVIRKSHRSSFPHFGGIWEAAVKSMKTHLRRVLGDVKLTYEELSTLLSQIEACLNSRPLVPLPNDDDGIEALTPGHLLIGKPLTALPEVTPTNSISLLKRWQLSKALLRHFCKRWSSEYISQLGRFNKWQHHTI